MTTTEKITIPMSETPPVKIRAEDWRVIARADRHDGVVECQANTEWAILVRAHADGRRLVHGWQVAGNGGKAAGYRPTYAGYLIAAGTGTTTSTLRAIRRVAGVLGDEALADECIQALPSEEI